jgi:hypothetical protein
LNYVFFAIFQSISIAEQYGFVICSFNLILFLLIAAFWLWEMIAKRNEFIPRKPPAALGIDPRGFILLGAY